MFYKVHPYNVYGASREGKTHKVDDGRPGLTFCGKSISAMPGAEIEESSGRIDCKQCLGVIESKSKWAQWQSESEERRAEYQREREEWKNGTGDICSVHNGDGCPW
jgi:hypothetical protein